MEVNEIKFKNIDELVNAICSLLSPTDFLKFIKIILKLINPDNKQSIKIGEININYKNKQRRKL